MVVSNIFGIFTPKLGEDDPIWGTYFQMGWNHHQPVIILNSLKSSSKFERECYTKSHQKIAVFCTMFLGESLFVVLVHGFFCRKKEHASCNCSNGYFCWKHQNGMISSCGWENFGRSRLQQQKKSELSNANASLPRTMFGIVATIKLLLLHSREGTITYPTWKKRKSSSKVPFKRGICDRSPGGYQRPLELNFSWQSSDFSVPTSKTPKPTKRELNDTVFWACDFLFSLQKVVSFFLCFFVFFLDVDPFQKAENIWIVFPIGILAHETENGVMEP